MQIISQGNDFTAFINNSWCATGRRLTYVANTAVIALRVIFYSDSLLSISANFISFSLPSAAANSC